MMDLVLDTRYATKNGTELDAIEHADALVWRTGERNAIKTRMRRRDRRGTRAILRALR